MEICSYSTYKKRENPREYASYDGGGKSWYRETVDATLRNNGWKFATEDYDLGLFSKHKPKDVAEDSIRSLFDEDFINSHRFVYYAKYASGNYYYDILNVYYKSK